MQGKAIHPGTPLQHESSETSAPAKPERDRGLLLIGLFKLGKALFFLGIGAGALQFIHKDLGDTVLHIATKLKRDPEGKLVGLLMAKVDLIDHHRLREISIASIAYAGLALTEGIGLMMQQVWAEYLTLCLTVSFLPWEIYELVRDYGSFRVLLLVLNLLVLFYLLWLLRRKASKG